MKTWFRDTLAKRLFLLIWFALVASHLVAFQLVTGHFSNSAPDHAVPTFPSLPPTPGLPGAPRGEPPPPRDAAVAPPARPPGAPRLSTADLVLDYGARLLLIALAAWLGARWLARPVQRLVAAAGQLGRSIGHGAPPQLDEGGGTHEVREAARVFNRMARELDEQFRSRELLMAALSHDLRTPLTRLRMRLESIATQGGATPEVGRGIADIQAMDALIGNTLETFRISHAPLERRPTDLHALASSVVDDHAEQGAEVVLHGGSVVAPADAPALRRVLANLIGNALRYGRRAEVRVAQRGDTAILTVDDAGPGIPPEHLDKVFRPFYRVDRSRSRDTGGIGLGLYIAKDLTERQGGHLTLANRREGGLRAEVALPLARS